MRDTSGHGVRGNGNSGPVHDGYLGLLEALNPSWSNRMAWDSRLFDTIEQMFSKPPDLRATRGFNVWQSSTIKMADLCFLLSYFFLRLGIPTKYSRICLGGAEIDRKARAQSNVRAEGKVGSDADKEVQKRIYLLFQPGMLLKEC